MPGRTEILTRAYQRINKVLQLAGSETINSIDIDAAFPVHDLDGVISAELVDEYQFTAVETAAGAGGVSYAYDLTNLGAWCDGLRVNGQRIVTPATRNIDFDEQDVYILSVTTTQISGTAIVNCMWWMDGGTGTTQTRIPISSYMTTIAYGAILYDENTSPVSTLPFKVFNANVPTVTIQWAAAADDAENTIRALVAPKGVIPKWPFGVR